MKIDLYTKAVFTVIAACLVYLCIGAPPVISKVQAQAATSRVIVEGFDTRYGVQRLGINGEGVLRVTMEDR